MDTYAKPNNIYDKTVDNSKYLGTGITQGTVEQSFVCTEDTLDGVKVKTQIVGRRCTWHKCEIFIEWMLKRIK